MTGYVIMFLIFIIVSVVAVYGCKKYSDGLIKQLTKDKENLDKTKFLDCACDRNVIYCEGCKECRRRRRKK